MPHFDRNAFSPMLSVGHLVALLNQLKDRLLEKHIGCKDVTAAQFKVILLLRERGVSTSSELGRLLSLDSGAMTRMLDRLVAKELVRREPSASDRRQVHIVLSQRGETFARRVPGIAADAMNELTGCLTAGELAEFQRLLRKMLLAADALPQDATDTTA